MRHGQSLWNLSNRFTGCVDIPLSAKGIDEAIAAGNLIKNIHIDVIFVSALIRASMTAMIAMSRHSPGKTPVLMHSLEEEKMPGWSSFEGDSSEVIPVFQAWQLNERMYGGLQGLNKAETIKKFGEEQVKLWRRSYDVPPPKGESLKMTAERSIPYFQEKIFPELKSGKNVFVVAHGNSLRSIIMFLENLTEDEVLHLELATGIPTIYDYDRNTFVRKSL